MSLPTTHYPAHGTVETDRLGPYSHGFIISKANLSTSVYQAFNLLWPFGSLKLETQHHLEASRIAFYQPNAGVGPN